MNTTHKQAAGQDQAAQQDAVVAAQLAPHDGGHDHIPGWGADLDRNMRPGVPMERTPPRLPNAPVPAPPQQQAQVEVFVSPERPHITPLFGSSVPPSGLSGLLRRLAYKMTENDVRHFMLLLLADRINMVEGLGQDVLGGRLPNLLGEMGFKSEWQHNRGGLIRKAAVAGTVAGIGYYLLTRRRR